MTQQVDFAFVITDNDSPVASGKLRPLTEGCYYFAEDITHSRKIESPAVTIARNNEILLMTSLDFTNYEPGVTGFETSIPVDGWQITVRLAGVPQKHMDHVRVDVEPLSAVQLNENGKHRSDASLKLANDYAAYIPPLPMVVNSIMRFDTSSKDASSQSLENIIAPDKGIAGEILRVANSTFYGRSGKVQSLKDAITLLGLKAVRNLVIFLSTKGLIASLKGDVFKKYLHEYPIVAALVAQDLVRPLGAKEKPEEVFLAGLFHRIGMTVLALKYRREYEQLLNEWKPEFDLPQMELARFQIDQLELGRIVCEKWNLPSRSVFVASRHGKTLDTSVQMFPIVVIAGYVAKRFTGLGVPDSEQKMTEVALQVFGKKMADITAFLAPTYFDLLKHHPFYEQAVG